VDFNLENRIEKIEAEDRIENVEPEI